MAMPPSQAYKNYQLACCRRGDEIMVSEIWRYSDHVQPPAVMSSYEVVKWQDGKRSTIFRTTKKIDLFNWLRNRALGGNYGD